MEVCADRERECGKKEGIGILVRRVDRLMHTRLRTTDALPERRQLEVPPDGAPLHHQPGQSFENGLTPFLPCLFCTVLTCVLASISHVGLVRHGLTGSLL